MVRRTQRTLLGLSRGSASCAVYTKEFCDILTRVPSHFCVKSIQAAHSDFRTGGDGRALRRRAGTSPKKPVVYNDWISVCCLKDPDVVSGIHAHAPFLGFVRMSFFAQMSQKPCWLAGFTITKLQV